MGIDGYTYALSIKLWRFGVNELDPGGVGFSVFPIRGLGAAGWAALFQVPPIDL